MRLRMWTYDVAREQCPTLDHLRTLCKLSLDSGYNAIGLYLEHRFAYRAAPWAAGHGVIEREDIRSLEREFTGLTIIPFINLLGHFEGFLNTEEGRTLAEEPFKGMQACPSNPDVAGLCHALIEDTLEAFSSEIIHIGGDETQQLGMCPECINRVDKWAAQGKDGKAQLYGSHFGPMARRVLAAGRRPAVWGDMFLEHPEALSFLPRETLIFDWQYFDGCRESSRKFTDAGFEVVCCPTLHVYNAAWCHLTESEENVRRIIADAKAVGAHGLCLTTWESGLFGAYDTLFAAIRAAANLFSGADTSFLDTYRAEDERYEVWAQMMGQDLQSCGEVFRFSGHRSWLKSRFVLAANPFLFWLHHREELAGEAGQKSLELADQSLRIAPTEAAKGVSLFLRSALEFVRIVELARQEYSKGATEAAIAKLILTRQLFDDLTIVAKRSNQRIGGSLADIERCHAAKAFVEKVIVRIRRFGDGSLGYVPSFEHLVQHEFMPQDQAAWWRINNWVRD